MSKILMGSQYFFSCYDDFKSKDIDEIEIIETNDFKYQSQLTGQGRCLFRLRKQPNKEDYINYALQSSVGMVIGKFLVPEFCELIGFTWEDLSLLNSLIAKLDEKHMYEKIIYESYIENRALTLTQEQKDRAYQSYKTTRGG